MSIQISGFGLSANGIILTLFRLLLIIITNSGQHYYPSSILSRLSGEAP